MSDITGSSTPNNVAPLSGTGKPSAVTKDPHRDPTQGGGEKGDARARSQEAEAAYARDPAVSISASAAHLQVGDRLAQSVDKIDATGRPIIVTDTATFALRPDAGLKPGDDVVLRISEAGKTISAELLSRNGQVIDPPEKLNLTVIAIHKPEVPVGQDGQPLPTPAPAGAAYGRGAGPTVRADAASETLASLLGRNAPSPLPPGAPAPAVTDPLLQRASSSDLAALIAAQQGRAAPQGLYKNSSALIPPGPPAAAVPSEATVAPTPGHLIPPSPLTALEETAATQAAGTQAGLGAAITAFTPDGVAKQVQQIDATISRVPPAQVAEVLQVQQLSPDEARTLNLPLSAFESGALAHVETSRGPIIMSQAAAAPLAGELIKISDVAAPQTAALEQTATLYRARLTPPNGPQQPVQVAIVPAAEQQAQAAAANIARVKAVHTIRAFLTPEGPKTDIRLETTRGLLSLTLPTTVRPLVGDSIDILPLPGAAPAATAQAAEMATQAAQAAAQGALQSFSTGWPALEAAQTLLASAAPVAGNALANRGADGGGKLTNSLLFFLKAAGASPEAWLGDGAARALAERDAPLFELLRQNISHMASMATHTVGEWRAALLPFDMRNADMPLVALLFTPPEQQAQGRQGGQGGEEGLGDEKSQHFLVEVRFSLLGAVQLDGLIRDRQFDLTLRSERALSGGLKTDAMQLFDAALGANGFTGRLSFSEGEAFPLQVDALLASRAREIGQQQTA